jgi:uncharacterized protein YggE
MIKRLFLLLLFFSALILLGDVTPDGPFIHVRGHKETKVFPDMAVIGFAIERTGSTYDEALSQLDSCTDELLQRIDSLAIALEDIESYDIEVDEHEFYYDEYAERDLSGDRFYFEANRRFPVVLRDLELFGRLSDALHEIQGRGFSYASFDVSNRPEILDELLDQAISDPKKRANSLSERFGATLGEPYSIADESFESIRKRYIDDGTRRTVSSRMSTSDRVYFIPKYLELNRQVFVIYRLLE